MTDQLHATGDVVGGRYRIVECIGEGGMQQVYKAIDTTFRAAVALKVPKNPSAEKRFRRSAQLSAKVTHPNVAKTLDYFEEGDRPYLIEELVFGRDLGEWMRTGFFYLDPHMAAHVLHHLCKGLAASHHVNVFHRDLKPSNIMVSADLSLSVVKVTDFGISKMAEVEINDAIREREESITSSQTVVGALPYMAPELIESPTQAGLEADIWSVGAMMYQLVSGKHPFGAGLGAVP